MRNFALSWTNASFPSLGVPLLLFSSLFSVTFESKMRFLDKSCSRNSLNSLSSWRIRSRFFTHFSQYWLLRLCLKCGWMVSKPVKFLICFDRSFSVIRRKLFRRCAFPAILDTKFSAPFSEASPNLFVPNPAKDFCRYPSKRNKDALPLKSQDSRTALVYFPAV